MPVDDMTTSEARSAVDAVRADYDNLTARVTELWERRAWIALGYDSWEAMCGAEFPGLLLPRAVRQDAVADMRSKGMSTRAISAAISADDRTIRRDLAGAANAAPASITGTDGKRYQPVAKPPAAPPAPATELLDLRSGLVRIVGLLGIVAGCIDDLGRDAVVGDGEAVNHMLTVSHLVADAFAPFVSADAIGQAAANWAVAP
jgi:hypothetical protein